MMHVTTFNACRLCVTEMNIDCLSSREAISYRISVRSPPRKSRRTAKGFSVGAVQTFTDTHCNDAAWLGGTVSDAQ